MRNTTAFFWFSIIVGMIFLLMPSSLGLGIHNNGLIISELIGMMFYGICVGTAVTDEILKRE